MPVVALFGPQGIVASNVHVANKFWSRLRGLLGRSQLAPDEGLLLTPCRRVHTFGMSFPIDAVFCDAEGTVVSVQSLRRHSFSRTVPHARSCLELAFGRARECGIDVGVPLSVR